MPRAFGKKLSLALGLALCVLALLAAAAAARTVNGSNGCGKSEYRPDPIVFACADGKVLFQDPEWSVWDADEARATGILTHPDLEHPSCANKPILACPWVEAEATVRLWRPVHCASNGRWQFTRLRLEAPTDVDPDLRVIEQEFKCSEYGKPRSKPRRMRLGKRRAAGFMRDALGRRPALNFSAGSFRRVKCPKRVARDRLRCRMSWVVGDLAYTGKGTIWITYKRGNRYWNFSYRIVRFDEYCAAVVEGSDCTKTFVAR